ncbi:Spy0128 family protein [Collinsella sp. LCP21S3_A3]|uniref:Spy0128 family protein n=1 Tax=Collinsella sp. LCP21S3_A3 TaxID=3438769 RepID=UPI003F8F31F6
MSKYTRGFLAVMLAVVLVLPAAAFAMLPEANARSSTGMDGPTMSGKVVVDPDTSGRWEIWAAGHNGNKVTTQNVGRIWTDKTVKKAGENEASDFVTTLSAMSSTSNSTVTVTTPLDIVMVLDASGSMDGEMGGRDSTKRIDALKSAANSFIDTIAKQNEGIEGVDRQHKVAIVKFSGDTTEKVGNDTYKKQEHGRTNTYNYSQVMTGLIDCSGSKATDLKNKIDEIRPAGATRADNGLQLAEGITSGRAGAKKIVVFFTDGTPTSFSEFNPDVANAGVAAAKNMKDSKATVYTIGIFDGADPKASVQDSKTSQENKFMQAVSSNYPNATKWNSHGTRAENSDYYKSATNAEELKKVFDDISQAITSEAPYPTEIHKGYDETKSGYITFTDELGDFMQVDGFTEVVINGTPFTKASKTVNKETNTDTYEFTGKAKDLLITVQRAGDDNPQKGDIVTVDIPASLIPLSHFKTVDGKLSVDNVKPIQVKYASSVKSVALDNLFAPEEVTGLKAYIEKNTTVADDGTKTVNFYANKWETGALGNTVATFEPADTNRYYYFQKQTPIYTDKDCTQPAKNSLADTGTYYYKDEFEEQGENDEAKPASAVIEFIGGDAAKFDGAIVADEDGSLSFSVGTARLAFIDELHTTKESVGGNNTGTATDVLNPKWNNVSAKATATHVNSYLGNNGKISFNVTPTTVDTKASFGLTKVLEGRDWTDVDEFKFELSATSENDAPMPAHATATVTNDDLDDNGKAAIDFGEITCNKPGEYTYEVREVKGGAGGITYSENVATFKVTVAVEATGGLKADVEKISGETEFKNTYSAKTETPLTLEATKTLTGRPMADDEFKFALSYAGHDEVLLDATNKGGKVEFGPLTYTTESLAKLVEEGKASVDASSDKPTWTIRYIAAEQTGKLPAGVSATVSAIDACVTVVDNGDGTLTATAVYGDAGNEFVNTYTAAPVEASLVGKKNLQVPDGLTPADIAGKFTFTVTGEEGAPMPANASVTNDAKGKVDFGKITFTLDDLNKALGEKPEKREHTFTYTVTESGEVAGVTNDAETSRTVSFTVTDDGEGTLRVSRKPDGDAAFTFTNTYSVTPVEKSVTDQITATKVLTGRDLKAGEFRFELVEGEGEDAKVVATGTNNAEGKITMNAVKYDKPGKHTYTLREVNGNAGGITYSDAKFTIETTITDNGDGTLKAEHVLKGTEPAEFKNTYSVTPIDTELDFGLSKAIDGRDWTDADKFSFTITAPEGTPLPDPATVTVTKQDADNEGIAAIKFGKIHYTAAGTYKYEIRENAGSAAGMTYDAHVATAEVTVTENGDGTLTANVTKKESGRFTNTYRSELDYAAAGGLKLSKTLSGRPMTEGQFTFTVTPADEASAIALGLHEGANVYKSPATAEATVGLIDILAGHEVKFTQADAGKTFTYTVAEKNDGQPGYTYDEAVRTVTIAIADDGAGTLTATTTVSGGPNGTPVAVHKSGENKVESALVSFTNSYHASTDNPGGELAQIVATKTLTGRPLANGEFYFGIAYAGETEAIDGTVATNINGQVSFGALHYTTEMLADLVSAGRAIRTDTDAKLAWTINYTAFEYTSPLAAKGITAAKSSFSFKVIVVDNGDGTLTAKPDYGGVEPVFENVYGADAVDAALAGAKKLQAAEGLTPADITGKFTFTVTADEAGAPMPERTTATNDAAGNVDFGKIHFTLEDLNRALGVTDDATDKAEADEADEAEADEAEAEETDADADANADESGSESEPAAPIAPRSHTFTYTVTESGSAPGVTNDANATRKVSYTVTDDGAGHLKVVREGDDGAGFTFTNTYSVTPTDSVVTDQVKTVKRLTGRDLAAGEFTFELLEDGVVVATGTNDANGTVALSPIRYEAPGAHTYMLREACPNALGLYKGVTYDGTTYTVVTTVSDNGDGTLTATHKLEGTTESAGFTNKYHAMPTQVSIGAIKVLEGRELKKDEFSFKLVGEDIESTVTNDADGKINFDKFEYDEPGTYVYTISEVKGDEAGMTYDKSVFTATVNVADDGEGNLKANVAFTKGDKSVEGIVFNNTYKKPEPPVPTPDPGTPKTVTNIVKTVKGFLPTTGDQQTAALLMAFVIAIAGVGALVWGIRKR